MSALAFGRRPLGPVFFLYSPDIMPSIGRWRTHHGDDNESGPLANGVGKTSSTNALGGAHTFPYRFIYLSPLSGLSPVSPSSLSFILLDFLRTAKTITAQRQRTATDSHDYLLPFRHNLSFACGHFLSRRSPAPEIVTSLISLFLLASVSRFVCVRH